MMPTRRTSIAISVFVAAALYAVDAFADDAVSYCPRSGTTVTGLSSRDGETIERYKEADGDICQFTRTTKGRTRRSSTIRGLISPTSSLLKEKPEEGRHALESLWPLAVGKEAVVVAGSGAETYKYTYEITGRERIATKAGSFDTFVIRETRLGTFYSISGSFFYIYDRQVTWWYAPAEQLVVKWRSEEKAGSRSRKVDWEAVSIVRARQRTGAKE